MAPQMCLQDVFVLVGFVADLAPVRRFSDRKVPFQPNHRLESAAIGRRLCCDRIDRWFAFIRTVAFPNGLNRAHRIAVRCRLLLHNVLGAIPFQLTTAVGLRLEDKHIYYRCTMGSKDFY